MVAGVAATREPIILDMRRGQQQAAGYGHGAFDAFRAQRMHSERGHDQHEDPRNAQRGHERVAVAPITHAQGNGGGGHDHDQNDLVEGGMGDKGKPEHREQRDQQGKRQTLHQADFTSSFLQWVDLVSSYY